MIHGDLKGVSAHKYPLTASLIEALQPNILVDVSGNARITDFGLAQGTLGAVSKPERHSRRWTAPEVLAETGTPSTEADVFSFGMVMVEVCYSSATVHSAQVNSIFTSFWPKAFTGTIPFSDDTSPTAMMAIINGKRPPRPTHSSLTCGLWELMNQCWDQERHNRPRMVGVLFALNSHIHECKRASG